MVAKGLRRYTELLKLKQTGLLVFSSLPSLVIAYGGIPPAGLSLSFVSGLTLAVAGTTAINMYFDRDIDALMSRTRGRPLPSGEIDPPLRALVVGAALFAAGDLISLFAVNAAAAAFIFVGFFFDIFVYTLATKRRTPWSVIFGGVAGAAPALAGWAAASGGMDVGGILLALLIILWIPEHIWTLSIFYSEDYARAGVPMLPVVMGHKRAALAAFAASVGTLTVSLLAGVLMNLGVAFLIVAAAVGAALVALMARLYADPSKDRAIASFKAANASLGIIITGMLISALI